MQVEGEGAVSALIEGLRAAEDVTPEWSSRTRWWLVRRPHAIQRGGAGRAIAGMAVPVVTGIGHEPDTSIADMVADVRASTPTAAAETVAPSAGR